MKQSPMEIFGNDIFKNVVKGEGTVTKVVPFQKKNGRHEPCYGLIVTVKQNNEYFRFNVFEPYTRVIVKGEKITFKGTAVLVKKYGQNIFTLLEDTAVGGYLNNLNTGYGYQLSLFDEEESDSPFSD